MTIRECYFLCLGINLGLIAGVVLSELMGSGNGKKVARAEVAKLKRMFHQKN